MLRSSPIWDWVSEFIDDACFEKALHFQARFNSSSFSDSHACRSHVPAEKAGAEQAQRGYLPLRGADLSPALACQPETGSRLEDDDVQDKRRGTFIYPLYARRLPRVV